MKKIKGKLRKIFSRKHKYSSGKVRIRSEIPLEKKDIEKIVDIIDLYMNKNYYDSCYHISRTIFYTLDLPIEAVISKQNFKSFSIHLTRETNKK